MAIGGKFLRRCSLGGDSQTRQSVIRAARMVYDSYIADPRFPPNRPSDPLLPIELLPDPWIGAEAYTFVSKIYWPRFSASRALGARFSDQLRAKIKTAGMQL